MERLDATKPIQVTGMEMKKEKKTTFVRLVAISDTHGRHRSIPIDNVPKGDVLIHTGDVTNTGEFEQYEDFLKWVCTETSFEKLVIIAGNHDITAHSVYYEKKGRKRFHSHKKKRYEPSRVRELLSQGKFVHEKRAIEVIYLEDDGAVVENLLFWGSPWQVRGSSYFCFSYAITQQQQQQQQTARILRLGI